MFKPLNDYIYVEPKVEVKRSSGLILQAKDEYFASEGTVIGIGDQVTKVKIGDEIIFSSHFSDRIEIDFKKMLLVQEKNLYGVTV